MTNPQRPSFAPADHPTVPRAKVGILFANLGTPDGTDYWSVRRYLSEFLSDKRVIKAASWKWQPILQGIVLTFRPQKSGAAYKTIWNEEKNESPLLTITRDQTDAMRNRLQAAYGDDVMVEFCMRYGNPSVQSRIEKMVEAGCQKIVYFPLYPHYSGSTWATANDQLFRALMKQEWQPAVRIVSPYFDRPDYIDCLASSVEQAYAAKEQAPEVLVCSYHGLPESYLTDGDPYHCHCQKTTRLLREKLGWDQSKIVNTFQSRFGPAKWLRPYTVEEVARLAGNGVKRIAVIAPAFSADCIETLEEINEEIKESFLHAGGEEFTYIPCLNDSPAHLDVLQTIIGENLGGWVN